MVSITSAGVITPKGSFEPMTVNSSDNIHLNDVLSSVSGGMVTNSLGQFMTGLQTTVRPDFLMASSSDIIMCWREY